MSLPIFNFWFELVLLAALACVLIYLVVRTKVELARATEARLAEIVRRNSRRIWVLIAGTSVIIFGIIISPLPGPGLSVLGPLGLAILASEFLWARKLTALVKEKGEPLRQATQRLAHLTPRWVTVPVCLAYWTLCVLVAIYSGLPQFVIWPVASICFTPVFLWTYLVWKQSRGPAGAADASADGAGGVSGATPERKA